jgi:hypothetical protein
VTTRSAAGVAKEVHGCSAHRGVARACAGTGPPLAGRHAVEIGATTGRSELGSGGGEHAAAQGWRRPGHSSGSVAWALQLGPAASAPQLGGGGAGAAAWVGASMPHLRGGGAGAAARAGSERAAAQGRRGAVARRLAREEQQ